MKTTLLATALLMLASTAHTESLPSRGTTSRCWLWDTQGQYHLWICNKREATINATADAVARDAMRRNNAGRVYESTGTTTSVNSNGKNTGTSSTTTVTTFPPYYR